MTDCSEYYFTLCSRQREVLDQSLASAAAYTKSHSFIRDLELMIDALENRPEVFLLAQSVREYQHGLFFAATGHYRQAFVSLRMFMELALASVLFSSCEYSLRRWMRGEQDISWAAIIDSENGVLSTNYVKAFFEELSESAPGYRAIARTLYRECSEYLHGNYGTWSAPERLEFSDGDFVGWHEKAGSCLLVTFFCLAVRYLPGFAPTELAAVEGPMIDHLGHIDQVRRVFDVSVRTDSEGTE
jgi:hypothetical protein